MEINLFYMSLPFFISKGFLFGFINLLLHNGVIDWLLHLCTINFFWILSSNYPISLPLSFFHTQISLKEGGGTSAKNILGYFKATENYDAPKRETRAEPGAPCLTLSWIPIIYFLLLDSFSLPLSLKLIYLIIKSWVLFSSYSSTIQTRKKTLSTPLFHHKLILQWLPNQESISLTPEASNLHILFNTSSM